MTKKKQEHSQTKEIIWTLVNSFMTGGLVFLGALSTGEISKETIYTAAVSALIVFFTQFKQYWGKEEVEYCGKIKAFSII